MADLQYQDSTLIDLESYTIIACPNPVLPCQVALQRLGSADRGPRFKSFEDLQHPGIDGSGKMDQFFFGLLSQDHLHAKSVWVMP